MRNTGPPGNGTAAPVVAGHGGNDGTAIRKPANHTTGAKRTAMAAKRYFHAYAVSADLIVIAFAVADRGLA